MDMLSFDLLGLIWFILLQLYCRVTFTCCCCWGHACYLSSMGCVSSWVTHICITTIHDLMALWTILSIQFSMMQKAIELVAAASLYVVAQVIGHDEVGSLDSSHQSSGSDKLGWRERGDRCGGWDEDHPWAHRPARVGLIEAVCVRERWMEDESDMAVDRIGGEAERKGTIPDGSSLSEHHIRQNDNLGQCTTGSLLPQRSGLLLQHVVSMLPVMRDRYTKGRASRLGHCGLVLITIRQ